MVAAKNPTAKTAAAGAEVTPAPAVVPTEQTIATPTAAPVVVAGVDDTQDQADAGALARLSASLTADLSDADKSLAADLDAALGTSTPEAADAELQAKRDAALAALVAPTLDEAAPPEVKYERPVYEPTGEMRDWVPDGSLYLIVGKVYSVAIGDRYLSAHGGTVVSLDPADAKRGVELGSIIELRPEENR